VMVAMVAPVASSRFTRASTLTLASNLHGFHVSSFMEGYFVDCLQLTYLRTLPVSCRTSLTCPGSSGTSKLTWGVSKRTW
jgi:hypothetical protein